MAYVIKNGVIHYVGKGSHKPAPAKVEEPKTEEKKKTKKTAKKK